MMNRAYRERVRASKANLESDVTATAKAAKAGHAAAIAGIRWQDNPHPSGSREAYAWDGGHTIARHGLVANARRNRLAPSEFVALVRRVHGAAITTEWARELLA